MTGETLPEGAHDIRLNDGRLVACRCVALSGGATAILFHKPPHIAFEDGVDDAKRDGNGLTRTA